MYAFIQTRNLLLYLTLREKLHGKFCKNNIIKAKAYMCESNLFMNSHKYGIEENELLHTLNHHKKSCRVLKFNEDGALLFSASKDKSVVITDTETMKVTQTLQKAHRFIYINSKY